MKKRRKKVKPEKPHPKHDQYLLRIKQGERLYKFYYFRPMAGRREHFEYRILTKEKTNGMFEMVSYNFKIVKRVPQKSSVTRVPEISKGKLEDITYNVKIKKQLFKEVLGISKHQKVEPIKTKEMLMLSANTTNTVREIKKIKNDEIELSLNIPIVALKRDNVGIARNINGRWRLIGWGEIVQ